MFNVHFVSYVIVISPNMDSFAIWTFQNAPQLVGNIWMDQGKHVVFGEVLEGLEASWSFSMKTWSIFWTNYPKNPQAKLPVSHLEGFWLLQFLAIFWSQNQEVNWYESQLENLTIQLQIDRNIEKLW